MRTTLTLSEMEVGLWVLAAKLRKMGFTPRKADLDLWMRNSLDGIYKHIASIMDDIVVIPKDFMIDMFKEPYALKGIGTPEFISEVTFTKSPTRS
jgi:hypothetical protein